MKHISILIVGLLLLTSCSKKNVPSQALDPIADTKEIKDISPYIQDVKFIPLEENDNNLLAYLQKILLDTNGNLFIQDVRGKILKYDKSGKFLCSIGRKGRGEGEYMSVRDICLSNDGKFIMIYHLGGISVYDVNDGNFVKKIELPRLDYDGICPSVNNKFFLMAVAPTKTPEDFSVDFNTLYLFPEDGKEPIDQQIPRKDYIFNVALFTQSYDKSYYLRPLEGENILYKVKDGKISPIRSIIYGNKMAPAMSIFHNGELDFKKYIGSPYFKMTLYVHDTMDNLYFAAMGPKGNTYNFVYDQELQSGIHWENKLRDPTPALVLASDEEYMYVMLADVENYLDKRPTDMNLLTRYLVDRVKVSAIPYNGNPLIVKIKFKTMSI